jgi:hypothetical protein
MKVANEARKAAAFLAMLGFLTGALAIGAPAGAAAPRASNFSVDLHIYNGTMADLTNTGASYDDAPLTIWANVTIAAGQPDCDNAVAHVYVNTVEEGTGTVLGAINASTEPMFQVLSQEWFPGLYGTYEIRVVVMNGTDTSTQAEATVPSFVVRSSDLQLHGISVTPDLAYIGVTPVTIAATVHNHGNVAGHANVSFTMDEVYEIGWGAADLPPLTTLNITAVTNFSGMQMENGTHTIRARLVDLNPTTSVSDSFTLLNPAPQVRLTGMDASVSEVTILRGVTSTVTVTAHILNNGTADAAMFPVYFYESDLLHPFQIVYVGGPLGPGEAIDASADWTVTDATPLGDHVVWAGVEPQTAAEDFVNVTVTVNGLANISRVDLLATPVSAQEGDTITLTATVHNSGTADAANVTIQYFDGETLIGTQSALSVPANGTLTAQPFMVRVHNITTDTPITYKAQVGDVWDTGTVMAKDRVPVLAFQIFDAPASMRIGDRVPFSVNVKNTGNADALNVTVAIYDGIILMNDTDYFNLSINGSENFVVYATMAGNPDANHTFTAKAAGIYTHVVEVVLLGQANLTRMVGHTLSPASVTITVFSVKPTKKDGQPKDSAQGYELSVTLVNGGELATKNCTLTILEGKKVIATQAVSLAGGANWTNTFTWKISGAGDHKAVATLSGADAGTPYTKTVKATLNYTPGFDTLAAFSALVLAGLLLWRRKR